MIELAPNHKIGLSLRNPVLVASGCGGYGHTYRGLIDLAAFGAVVTNPITLRPRRGSAQPRLVETKAGFVLNTGQQNPGVRKVMQQYSPSWSRLGVPIIAHLPADEPDNLRRTARVLAGVEAVAAIELGLPPGAVVAEVEGWIRAVTEDCQLPLLVKLPLTEAVYLAEPVAAAGADALVVGGSPPGAAILPPAGELVEGFLYGPALHSLTLQAVSLVKGLVDVPVVAAGGIHSLADIAALLQVGATAMQLDSLLLVDPQAAYELAAALVEPKS
jgi:dihydroorotate dehydrogenase (NAD+) catalytic subunit